ncbi:hypothetical protein L5515_009576 [Caenorhabditis briggsae]|uniref:Uncharacterized protein n=1 Tax=Caenorhabditis briggsae TaxID=6238 RepID=A0AAE9F975_CAEBR|nr:hypothetical protein L5515_009576 [Caenorhabditis briggsae]
MDIREITEKLTIVIVTSMTSESVAEYEHDVDEYVRLLENQLEIEMEKKRKMSNRIGLVECQISELWDRVDKARRRETDVSNRVTAWALHLTQLMNEVKQKRAHLGATMDSSASLDAEIQECLDLLAEKRELVDRMKLEIDFRRGMHKNQLKQLKLDCDYEDEKFREWTQKSEEIEKVIFVLKEQKKVLGERIENEKRMEQEQKKMLEDLEILMKKSQVSKRKNYGNQANLIASLSTITTNSSSF